MSRLKDYLEKYALLSMERQEKFNRLAGEHSMEVDLDAGAIRITGGLEFPFQVLGTESHNTLTWLWAWAEEQTEIPADLLRSSLEMKAWGEKERIPECTMPSVDLNRADGHVLSMIASEVCHASCYYHDPYEGGALFLLLFNDAIDRQPSLDSAGLIGRLSHLVSLYEFNHLNAVRSYFLHKGLPLTEHATFIVARTEQGEDLRANFDSTGRLLSVNGREFSSR